MTGPPCFSRFCFRPGATQPSEVLLRASRTGRGPLAGAPPAPGPRLLVCVRSRLSHRGRRLSSDLPVFPDPVHSEQRVGLFSLGVFLFISFIPHPPPRREDRIPHLPVLVAFAFRGGHGAPRAESWEVAGLHPGGPPPCTGAPRLTRFTGVAFYFCKPEARPTCSGRIPARVTAVWNGNAGPRGLPLRDLEA